MDIDSFYICMKTTDMPIPYVPCHKGKCRDCKQDVYYSKYAYANNAKIKEMVDAGNILCIECATKIAKKDGNPTVVVTEATLKELDSTYVADKQP